MKKIYLAVDETSLSIIEKAIKASAEFAESELLLLHTLEEIRVAITQPFDIFISLSENIEKINNEIEQINGYLWVIDSTNNFKLKGPKVKIFKNGPDVRRYIAASELANKNLTEKTISEPTTKNESSEKPTNDASTKEAVLKMDVPANIEKETEIDKNNSENKEVPKEKSQEIDDSNTNDKVQYAISILERGKMIKNKSFSLVSWPNNTTIGVWSPIPSIGVSTFVINFAIYLRNYYVPTCVIETPNDRQCHRSLLKRYDEEPEGWHSFTETLLNEQFSGENVNWVYKGIDWVPLGPNDYNYEWNKEISSVLFNNAQVRDFVIADLPSGKMKQYTLDCLPYLNELWILIDDDYNKFLAWKEYIHTLINEYKLEVKIIFNKSYSFSRHEDICKELELPLFAVIPNIDKESRKNMYQDRPLIDNHSAYKELHPPYQLITEELLGKDYMQRYKERVWNDIKNMFFTKVDSVKRKMLLWR